MADKEVEIINHLLEVEQNAAALTVQAQEDADKRISIAKAKADSEFKSEFERIVADNEKEYETRIAEIELKSKVDVEKFKSDVSKSSKSIENFSSYLDKILFA